MEKVGHELALARAVRKRMLRASYLNQEIALQQALGNEADLRAAQEQLAPQSITGTRPS